MGWAGALHSLLGAEKVWVERSPPPAPLPPEKRHTRTWKESSFLTPWPCSAPRAPSVDKGSHQAGRQRKKVHRSGWGIREQRVGVFDLRGHALPALLPLLFPLLLASLSLPLTLPPFKWPGYSVEGDWIYWTKVKNFLVIFHSFHVCFHRKKEWSCIFTSLWF